MSLKNPMTFAAHNFTMQDWDDRNMPFNPSDYSLLKFGCDRTAKAFGWTVADRFFAAHADLFMDRQAVVLPSPYNYVPNAAMVMTQHMINRLNHHIAAAGGKPVEFSLIRRKLTFTIDYGFLSKQERIDLLTRDQMYINEQYLHGKTLIFADDIRITGTNERCMEAILEAHPALHENPLIFLYFAQLQGEGRPDVEAALNLSSIKSLREYVELTRTPNHHVIVRPIKFALTQPAEDFRSFLLMAKLNTLIDIYNGCIGEGYYDQPGFVENFQALHQHLARAGYFSNEAGPVLQMAG